MNNREANDEINLIDLIVLLLKRKILLVTFTILGLIIGVAYTLIHEPRYQTAFTVEMDHPLIHKDFVITSEVKQLIASSQMYGIEGITPHLLYSPSTGKFKITTNNREIQKTVESLFTDSIKLRIKDLIKTARIVNSDQIDFLSDANENFSPDMLLFLIGDEKLNEVANEALGSLKFNYGPTITHHPKERKYGLIGLVIGLIAGILMVILSMLFDTIKSRQNTP